jgi:muramoyltetrapeptide carboxypeptidase LdcA involved in peptidoglycan recycling
VDCMQPGGQDYTLVDVIRRLLGDLSIPVGFGLPSGHVSSQPNRCLPIGVAAELVVTESEVKIKVS